MLWNFSEINPISGFKTAPPTIAMTIKEPPILVFGPQPPQSQREDGREHQRHEEAG